MSTIELLHPGFLALALLAPLVWFWPKRARGRAATLAALRSLVVVLLAFALARPVLWQADEREHAVFVVDLSRSIEAKAREKVVAELPKLVRALPSNVVPELVVIAGDEGEARGLEDALRARVGAPCRVDALHDSPLGAALELALARIPAGARGSVTLVSDGRATDANWGDALLALQDRGIPLHAVRLDAATPPAFFTSITCADARGGGAPRVGFTARVAVGLVGRGPAFTVVLTEVDGPGGEREIARRADASVDGTTTLSFDWEPRAPGFARLRATIEGAPGSGSTVLTRTIAVQPPLEALYLGARVAEGRERLSELVGSGITFTPAPASDAMPDVDLDRYDLVVIDDAPAAGVSDALEQRIATAVRERGLGVVLCGGEASFGPGGWADSPLADVLPVECIQKEEKRDPSTTLALVIDTSGSMVGERIQLAKEVARLAMSRLLPHDKVGIVEFYGAKRWAAPIQPASNTIDLARAINRMDAGGGTIILPAIEEAYYGMQNVQTRYKHVLVLTDGGVENGAFEPLLRRMADEGIAVSTVLIGAETHSDFLVTLANWGKGRFYAVPDRFNLPEILLKQPTTSRLPAYQPGNFTVVAHGGPGWWGGVERAQLPELSGYVETRARPGAVVLMEVEGVHHPLLATTQSGLGRATTFASEPAGPGTRAWSAWKDWGRVFGRVLARTADDGRTPFRLDVERRGGAVHVVATRRASAPPDALPVVRRDHTDVRGDSNGVPIALDERADGTFRGALFVHPDEELRLVARAAGLPTSAPVYAVSNARDDVVTESAVDPARALDLERAARACGGTIAQLDALASFAPKAGGGAAPRRLAELAPWLLALALATWIFELYQRRRDVRAA
ncbi:MAG: VWA domain-containing protein [Planctomycetes bacterium]|nr:VWA domain-containing protein [Planctomycetota bacterium]